MSEYDKKVNVVPFTEWPKRTLTIVNRNVITICLVIAIYIIVGTGLDLIMPQGWFSTLSLFADPFLYPLTGGLIEIYFGIPPFPEYTINSIFSFILLLVLSATLTTLLYRLLVSDSLFQLQDERDQKLALGMNLTLFSFFMSTQLLLIFCIAIPFQILQSLSVMSAINGINLWSILMLPVLILGWYVIIRVFLAPVIIVTQRESMWNAITNSWNVSRGYIRLIAQASLILSSIALFVGILLTLLSQVLSIIIGNSIQIGLHFGFILMGIFHWTMIGVVFSDHCRNESGVSPWID